MKRVLLLLLAGLMSFGVAIKASADARLNSLGADVRQVEDIDSIFLYANKILEYKNTVDFRLNPTAFGAFATGAEWGGIIHDMGDDFGVIAVYANRPTADTGTVKVAYPLIKSDLGSTQNLGVGGSFNANKPTNNNLDLFWGNKINGIGDAALHLTYADASPNLGGVDSQVWGLQLGLGLGSFLSFQETNLHIGYVMDSITDSTAATPLKDNGVYSITAGFLALTDLDSANTMRLSADVEYDNTSLPNGFTGGPMTANDSEFLLGTSVSHKISGKGFVNCGIELEYDGANLPGNVKSNIWSAIWNGSVESSLCSWLTARAGLTKAIFNRTYTGTTPASYTDLSIVGLTNGTTSFNLGASINVENWTLDTQVSAASFEGAIAAPAPGRGIIYGDLSGASIVAVTQADLRYKF